MMIFQFAMLVYSTVGSNGANGHRGPPSDASAWAFPAASVVPSFGAGISNAPPRCHLRSGLIQKHVAAMNKNMVIFHGDKTEIISLKIQS